MGYLSSSTPVKGFGSLTPTLPPTFSAGSLLILAAGELAGSGPVPDMSASGYTTLSINTSGKACALYGTIAIGGGSDVAPSINYSANRNFALMAAYDGYTLTTARAGVERASNATSGVFLQSATLATDDQLVIAIAMRNNATSGAHTIGSAPQSFAIRQSALATNTSEPLAVYMDWVQTTATNITASSVSTSPADSATQTVQAQLIFLAATVVAPNALLSWPKQTFVTETIIQV
jgi:hypothetical protein